MKSNNETFNQLVYNNSMSLLRPWKYPNKLQCDKCKVALKDLDVFQLDKYWFCLKCFSDTDE